MNFLSHRMSAVWKLAACAILSLLLTGCWDSADLDNIAYVHSLGVDYDHGHYKIWLGLIDPTKSGIEESKSTGETSRALWVVYGTGRSFLEAVNAIYPSSPKRVSWSHFSLLILHENVLRGPYKEVIEALTRYREVRYTSWVYGTKDTMGNLFTANLPVENNPLYYYVANPKRVQQFGYVVPSVRLNEWQRALHEPVGSAILPQMALNHQRDVHWPKSKDKPYDELLLPTVGVFRHERFMGWLSHRDMLGVFWARTGGTRVPLFLPPAPGSTEQVILYIHHLHVEIHPMQRRHHWTYDLKISGPVDLAQEGQGRAEKEIITLAERVIERDVRRTFRTGVMHHADILNITPKVYRGALMLWPPNTRQKLLNNLELRADSLRNVNIHLTLVHTGMRTVD
ncbi:Ger(x)C family spore germination protein [Ferroacidibacillus organovorans]|uniref:Ger(x)C family spore germination protein n=1 Tax=Ferroacidibacillus organovorans TaxID=1765683 RepID=UPI0009EE2309|nr:Ger(x)C family spore germination C-terminal domain-containing protein [Ferroacidibacillus organovorans]